MFLAVGTSGVVYPAAGLVLQARAAGAEAWLVNAEAADNARAFHHFVQGPSGKVLPDLFEWASTDRGPPRRGRSRSRRPRPSTCGRSSARASWRPPPPS